MKVRIAARRCHVPEPVLERARERLSTFVRYDRRLAAADLVFEEERHRKRVEAVLTVDRVEPLVAEGEGPDFRDALDRMLDRLSRKLRRRRARAVERQAAGKEIAG